MDLITTTYCPNNCSYCFTKEISKKDDSDHINETTYKQYLKLLKSSSKNELRFFGGEPFANPDFSLFLSSALSEKWINRVTVFTSGVINSIIPEFNNDMVTIVVNVQVPYGKNGLNDTVIQFLREINKLKCQIWISLNFFRADHILSDLEEVLRDLGLTNIRFSFANSAHNKSNERLFSLSDYNVDTKMVELIYNTFSSWDYKLHFDGALPLCSIPHSLFSKFSNRWPGIFDTIKKCQPPLEFFPDKTIRPCANLTSIKYVNMNSVEEVNAQFYWEFSRFRWYTSSKKCESCDKRVFHKCQMGCMGTRTDLVQKRQEYLTYKESLNDAVNFVKLKKYSESLNILKSIDQNYEDYIVQGLLMLNYLCLKEESKLKEAFNKIDKAYIFSTFILYINLRSYEEGYDLGYPRRMIEERFEENIAKNVIEHSLINEIDKP